VKRGRKRHTSDGRFLSQAAFCRLCGLGHRSTVLRAVESGRVVLNGEGLVDTRHPANARFLRGQLTQSSIRAAPLFERIKAELQTQLQ